MRVLIADDDAATLATLRALLLELGHEAVVATDGAQAWDIIQRADAPSVAILDWMMPHMDGIEICRRLRLDGARRYQYLIVLTARDQMDDLVESMDAGADDYLSKPFDARELRARLAAGQRILARHDALLAKAMFDALTGTLSRAAIVERLENAVAHVSRKGGAVSIVFADLDDFKAINDTHGHPVGDVVLREAAKRLTNRLRPYDELGRYGGEEFLAVLPGCDITGAFTVAERMRKALADLPVDTPAGSLSLTASLGVASVNGRDRFDIDAFIAAADEALYRAKRAGRNRVEGALDNRASDTRGARDAGVTASLAVTGSS